MRGEAPIGRRVGWGLVWMVLNTGASKLISFAAQVILGVILSAHDFGVFAIATSITALTSVLRDGGIRHVLVQQGEDYESLVGPLFWMGMCLNLAVAILLAAATPAIAAAYHEPEIRWLLLLTAISIPLGTPTAVLSARLAIDLRFKAISIIRIVSAVIRYVGSVALAYAGYGALSFVLPFPLVALSEWLMTAVITRTPLWSRAFEVRRWAELFSRARWVLVGTLGVALNNTGTYFLIGVVLPTDVVGVYFFAYQIVIQIGVLLAHNVNQVLFPAFAKLRGAPERQRAAVLRSLRMLMLIATPISVFLLPVFPPLEEWVWHRHWAGSVASVQVLSICYPFSVIIAVPMALELANGNFRRWGTMLLAYATGLVLTGGLGAATTRSATGVAIFTGAYSVIAALAFTRASLRPIGIGVRASLRVVLPIWTLSSMVGIATLGLERTAMAGTPPIIRVIVTSVVFTIVLGLSVRLVLVEHIIDALTIAPVALRKGVMALLRLEPPRVAANRVK